MREPSHQTRSCRDAAESCSSALWHETESCTQCVQKVATDLKAEEYTPKCHPKENDYMHIKRRISSVYEYNRRVDKKFEWDVVVDLAQFVQLVPYHSTREKVDDFHGGWLHGAAIVGQCPRAHMQLLVAARRDL
eukprot:5982920-Amphidinium_carterae.1